MKIALHELAEKYKVPTTWLAQMLGYSRTRVSNWITDPEKYPVPENEKKVIEEKLRELGSVLSKIELK